MSIAVETKDGQPTSAERTTAREPGALAGGSVLSMGVYLVLLSVVLLYALIQIWPVVDVEAAGASARTFTLFAWTVEMPHETRLLYIVALAGGLGGLIHAIRSYSWYVGHRALDTSWLATYLLLPYVGAMLSLMLYFVIRGGLFAPGASPEQVSSYGFAALGVLAGLFSSQWLLKMKELADTLVATRPSDGGRTAAPR